MRAIFGFLIVSLLCSFTAPAKTLDVVSGWDKPPYIIAQGHTGFEIELVKAFADDNGDQVNMMYVPYGRSVRLIKEKSVDIALSLNVKQEVPQSWLSDVYVIYQNVVVTLKSRHLDIDEMADLSRHTVVGFQTATSVLGPEFANAVTKQGNYLEMADQHRQVKMLMLESVDAIVLDRNIFTAIRAQLPEEQQKDVVIHELFPSTPYHAVIPNDETREAFNAALQRMVKDGRYEALITRFGIANNPYAQ